ncbi:MAG TPA: pitrilysin family protein [Blastocatellia bacterium]|nr:pitrilysin family protein [Blastocatellia bacterium]
MLIRKYMVLAVSLALLSGAAYSRGQSKAASFKVSFSQFQLDNGLRVILSEDHTAPVVAVAVYYDVGSRNEVKGRTGFAHLFEHMMFQGSENVGKGQYFKYVESNGGTLNGTTHLDYTNFFEFLPSNQLELALWLESDRMRGLKITPENLKNQQDAVKEEKRLSIDNQAYWPALNDMDEMVYRNWANAHPTMGSMEDLDAATVADVKAFFDTYYVPNNAVLSIAGDIDPARAESLTRKYFATIPRRKTPPPVDVSEQPAVAQQQSTATDPHAEVPALAVAWKIPSRRAPDFYPIALLKSILLDGDSARLYRKLVKEKAVALEVQGFLEEHRGPSDVSILCIHKAEAKPQDVLAIIESELDRVKKEGVTAEELTRIRNQYRLGRFISGNQGDEFTSLQTALGRAMALAEFTLFDGDPSQINTEIDRYLAVTPEQIRSVAQKYFGTVNRSVLYVTPDKKAGG